MGRRISLSQTNICSERVASVRFGSNLYDYSAPPTQDPSTIEIVTEVYNVLAANGVKPDPNALCAVYTSNFPNENYYCAFHDLAPSPSSGLPARGSSHGVCSLNWTRSGAGGISHIADDWQIPILRL